MRPVYSTVGHVESVECGRRWIATARAAATGGGVALRLSGCEPGVDESGRLERRQRRARGLGVEVAGRDLQGGPAAFALSAATTSIALHSFAVIPAGQFGGHPPAGHTGLLALLAKCVVRKSTGPIGASTRTKNASHGNAARSR